MTKIFVFTAGDHGARQHLADSIKQPIDGEKVFGSFGRTDHEDLSRIRREGDGFYAWGATPGSRRRPRNPGTWKAMARGDYVLCVYDSRYRYVSYVLGKYNNPRFARSVWTEDEGGQTWQYMYFLAKPLKVDKPLSELAGPDRLPKRYGGFAPISDRRLRAIASDYGSIDNFINRSFGYGKQSNAAVVGAQSMPEHSGGNAAVKQELERRMGMWESLLAAGGPQEVPPAVLRDIGIYSGGQGIWVNKDRTGSLTIDGTGVTVGVLHTGIAYADDLSEDGVRYHYPATKRPPGRDLSEINATKAAGTLSLPVFVITHSSTSKERRDARLGWVEDWDDSLGIFLIAFSDHTQTRQRLMEVEEEPFELIEEREQVKRAVKVRPGQQHFSFYVFQRYGSRCAVCELSVPEILEAAHLVPVRNHGSYDPRNGLVLCAVHHRAFDAGLFAIDPNTLQIRYRVAGPDAHDLRVDHETLHHLARQPHEDALKWRWNTWSQESS